MTAPSEIVPATKPSPFVPRVWEWLWRGKALQAATADRAAGVDQIALQRARVAAEVAAHALDPSGPWLAGRADHVAAALFLESIGWSLRAQWRRDDAAPPAGDAFDGPSNLVEFAQLFDAHEELLLTATDREGLARLRDYAAKREFERTTSRPDEAQIAARRLSDVAHRLLERAERERPPVERLLLQRGTRCGGVVVAVLVAAIAITFGRDWRERRADLSANRPWTTSSTYEAVCVSPTRRCEANKAFFFHTQEEASPWLELDLQRVERISSVRVVNRQDCCVERAVPLLVELSLDHNTWHEVARRNEIFDSWRPTFKPEAARWVRFRVANRSLLHLNEVRVLP